MLLSFSKALVHYVLNFITAANIFDAIKHETSNLSQKVILLFAWIIHYQKIIYFRSPFIKKKYEIFMHFLKGSKSGCFEEN